MPTASIVLPAAADSPVAIQTPHGWLGIAPLPQISETVDECLARACPYEIHDDEWRFVRTLRGYRRSTFIGGRVALAAAANASGIACPASLPNPRGAPIVPTTLRASVSHKFDPRPVPGDDSPSVAVALLAQAHSQDERIGVDVEHLVPRKRSIERHVLTPREQERVSKLSDSARALEVLRVFSWKESLYKALDPFVERYVGFKEVEVVDEGDDRASFRFRLRPNEGPFSAVGLAYQRGPLLVTTVRLAPL